MNNIDIFGFIAAIITTSVFFPQVIKTIKVRDTKSLSLPIYLILTAGLILWLTYGILIKDWALIIANSTTGLLALIILIVKIKYDLLSNKSSNRTL
ncbi:MAG: SemiSWEET transporter [Thermodesulfobacteriota bacterium]